MNEKLKDLYVAYENNAFAHLEKEIDVKSLDILYFISFNISVDIYKVNRFLK